MIQAKPRNYLFNTVHMEAPERNGFDLSHENKQTCRAGKLYPFEVIETLPNDDFEIQVEQLIRLQPMLSPTMHRLKAYWHFFFVPNRIVWKKWEEFISRGNGKKLASTQEYTPPEPPTFSLAQMLKCAPSAELDDVTEVETTGSVDDAIKFFDNYLQSNFPSVLWQPYDDGVHAMIRLAVIRTPRLCNSMGIPDVSYPLFYSAMTTSGSTHSLIIKPISQLTGYDVHNYLDYLADIKLSLIPLLSTFKIYCEYYRDENLQEDYQELFEYFETYEGQIDLTDDTCKEYFTRLLKLNYRCWEKDYFTTASLLPQKAPDVLIPGAGELISHTHEVSAFFQDNQLDHYIKPNGNIILKDSDGTDRSIGVNPDGSMYSNTGDSQSFTEYKQGLKIDGTLGTSCSDPKQVGVGTSATISMLRKAFSLQRWFEKIMRVGSRYYETIKAFFATDAGDARLQRPEFIGACSSPIKISDVVQSSATDEYSDTVQGNLAGYGVNADTSPILTYHTPEHGFIIGMFSIMARTSYSQGIHRQFTRESWLDYAWSDFENIGEQGIKQKELAFYPTTSQINWGDSHQVIKNASWINTSEEIFGYQGRYSEYKQIPDRFGAGFVSSLDFWSLGRIFKQRPTLSAEFVKAYISDRNFAVVGNAYELDPLSTIDEEQMNESYDYDTYICDFWLDIKKVTSLTLYSEPY